MEPEGGESSALHEWTATHPATRERLDALRRQLDAAGIDPAAGQAVADRFRRHVPAAE
ncbi:MAG: hypothetical protein ACLFRX_00920 [Gemmatimonadota bacterium]